MNIHKKLFGAYEVLICLVLLALNLVFFISLFGGSNQQNLYLPGVLIKFIQSLIGLIGGVCLLTNRKEGYVLSLIWTVPQIIGVQTGNVLWDFYQILSVDFSLKMGSVIIGFNIVGILLASILIKFKEKFLTNST
jgi:hypothetical protein